MYRKRNKLLSLFLVLSLFVGMVGIVNVDTTYAASKKIHVKKKTVFLSPGETYTQKLIAKNGKTIKATKVKWKSSNKSVAKISKKGKVTAVNVGTAKMTAKYKGKKYKFTVQVMANSTPSPNETPFSRIYSYVNAYGSLTASDRYISGDYCIESGPTSTYNSNGDVADTYYAIAIKKNDNTKLYFNMCKYYVGTGTQERTLIVFDTNSDRGETGFLQGYYSGGKFYQFISSGTLVYSKYTGQDYYTESGVIDISIGFDHNPVAINSYDTKYLVNADKELIRGVDSLLRSTTGLNLRNLGFSSL